MLDTLPRRQFKPIAREHYVNISEQLCPMRYETSASATLPERKLLGCRVGEIGIVHYESSGIERGVRTIEHIRAEPVDYFLLCLPLQARFRFRHAGLSADIGYGSAVLLTAQRPFDAYIYGGSHNDWHTSLQVRIPGPLLRASLPVVDHICNKPFPVLSGAGLMMQSMLQASLEQAGAMTESQTIRHCRVLADVVANALLPLSNGGPDVASADGAGSRHVFERAMAYIEGRLSSPALDADQIAEHCRVSIRYLYKVFAEHSLTIAATVREARLCRCREALRDLKLARRSVIEIAGSWGFSDPSHFGRLYKSRFGIPPSEERPRLPIRIS